MQLADLLTFDAVSDARFADIDVRGVSADSRKVKAGDLFVAVVGEFRSAGQTAVGPVVTSTAGSAPVAEETREIKAGLEPALDELRRHQARKLDLIDTSRYAPRPVRVRWSSAATIAPKA